MLPNVPLLAATALISLEHKPGSPCVKKLKIWSRELLRVNTYLVKRYVRKKNLMLEPGLEPTKIL